MKNHARRWSLFLRSILLENMCALWKIIWCRILRPQSGKVNGHRRSWSQTIPPSVSGLQNIAPPSSIPKPRLKDKTLINFIASESKSQGPLDQDKAHIMLAEAMLQYGSDLSFSSSEGLDSMVRTPSFPFSIYHKSIIEQHAPPVPPPLTPVGILYRFPHLGPLLLTPWTNPNPRIWMPLGPVAPCDRCIMMVYFQPGNSRCTDMEKVQSRLETLSILNRIETDEIVKFRPHSRGKR